MQTGMSHPVSARAVALGCWREAGQPAAASGRRLCTGRRTADGRGWARAPAWPTHSRVCSAAVTQQADRGMDTGQPAGHKTDTDGDRIADEASPRHIKGGLVSGDGREKWRCRRAEESGHREKYGWVSTPRMRWNSDVSGPRGRIVTRNETATWHVRIQ